MNIFYEKPECGPEWNYPQFTDKNGKLFWLNWSAWINSIKIDNKENIKELPEAIINLIPKWEQEFNNAKFKNKKPEYPIKLVSIHFIYDDKVYKLTPEIFSEDYNARYYFRDISKIIEEDLQGVGCIFTRYDDSLD